MTAPVTGHEQDPTRWTTLAEETAFLTQIAAETDATLTEAGRTVRNRPIHRIDIGAGPHTLLYIGLQHPGEPSGREALLELIRDLAYSTDPAVLAYLSTHRVVGVSNVNADGAFGLRDNVNGVNLNRDWFKLTEPETRAAHAVLRDVEPELVVDLHENGLDLPAWAGNPELIAGSHPQLTALGETLYGAVLDSLDAGGSEGGRYPRSSTPVSAATTAAGAGHAVALLSEPLLRDFSQPGTPRLPFAERVAVHRIAVQAVRQWHGANSQALAEARAASIAYASMTTDPVPLVSTEMVNGAVTMLDIKGYTLYEPLPPHLIEAHGITVDDTFVSVNQPARLAVAMLCDPESRDKVVSATRVPRIRPRPRGKWVDAHVMADGRKRKIVEAWHVVDGQKRRLALPGM